MSLLKKDSPPEIVKAIDEIETRADDCFKSLSLLNHPSNEAVWALLNRAIVMIEDAAQTQGQYSRAVSAVLQNVGRFAPIAIKWMLKHARPPASPFRPTWTNDLASDAQQALDVATHYSHFETCYPMWHRNYYLAKLLSPEVVRFSAPGTSRNHQVSAHMKGFRPKEGVFKGIPPKEPEQSKIVQAVFELALHGARMTGFTSFNYEDSWILWRELLPEYRNRVHGIARRSDMLSLGHYTLAEFKEFYAGLLSIAAAHDHLCFRWQRERGVYPVASAAMIRSQDQWITLLSELTSITKVTCESMIRDLSFDAEESPDLHLTPFVALDSLNLALVPQFPLHSLMDENILRICSRLRPNVFDATTLEKELESLLELEKRLPGRNLQGPIKMPPPIPDIDLLIADETSSTIVIAELKWIAKSIAPRQIVTKNNEVAHGMSQLRQIREFLSSNPLHLAIQKKLAKSFEDYKHIYFLLVARDHWLWIEPSDGIAVVEFEAFSKALQRTLNLNQAVDSLLTYEWLPVENRDFVISYDRAGANGVALESEVFYSI